MSIAHVLVAAAACTPRTSRKIAENRYHWISSQAFELMSNALRMIALAALMTHGGEDQPVDDAADALVERVDRAGQGEQGVHAGLRCADAGATRSGARASS